MSSPHPTEQELTERFGVTFEDEFAWQKLKDREAAVGQATADE